MAVGGSSRAGSAGSSRYWSTRGRRSGRWRRSRMWCD